MYQITTTKIIAGTIQQTPMITCDGLERANKEFNKLVETITNELNQEVIRMVGGNAEIYLEKTDGFFGGNNEIIRNVVIKRPLHSPQVCNAT